MDINSAFGSPFTNVTNISSKVTVFLNIALTLAGVILLFYFIMGGIGMISNAGGDNPQQMEQAKKTVTSALIGFVVVFAAFWIVKLIESITGASLFFK